jgi:hypothetical protein
MNILYHRCNVKTFKIQHFAFKRIVNIPNRKLRSSLYKLYRWICYKTDGWPTPKPYRARLKELQKAIGLSHHALIKSRKELERLHLIEATPHGGPKGYYEFSLLNAETGLPLFDWSEKPRPRHRFHYR